jgi:hypothetical protein
MAHTNPNQRIVALEDALMRARDRAAHCWTDLDRFRADANFDDPKEISLARKLVNDVRKAEEEVSWFTQQLDDARRTLPDMQLASERR